MENEISLSELFVVLKRNIKKITVCTLISVFLISVYTFFIVTPRYESTSKIVVNQAQDIGNTITNADIQTNLNLINTYQSIIKEPIILEEVIKSTGVDLTTQQLSKKINIQTEDSSLVFGVTVSDENPYMAAELSNATAETFQNKIGDILEVESVTILSQANPNINPVSPHIFINLVLGLIMGVTFGVGIAFIGELTDNRIKDSKSIEDMGWTNLGSVLEMSNEELKSTRINKQAQVTINNQPPLRRRV